MMFLPTNVGTPNHRHLITGHVILFASDHWKPLQGLQWPSEAQRQLLLRGCGFAHTHHVRVARDVLGEILQACLGKGTRQGRNHSQHSLIHNQLPGFMLRL